MRPKVRRRRLGAVRGASGYPLYTLYTRTLFDYPGAAVYWFWGFLLAITARYLAIHTCWHLVGCGRWHR